MADFFSGEGQLCEAFSSNLRSTSFTEILVPFETILNHSKLILCFKIFGYIVAK